MFRSRFSLVPICVEGIIFAFQMNNITKTKTATADAKFREMAQNVVMSSVAATKHSAKCDVTQTPRLQKSVQPPADMNAAADQFAQL
ncbi:hypothetical protein LSAT2_027918 [Lamellibrachia satsuma]|nr:hypothetical protein LSAT2_027918 [Lamellibrachia satsuma]